MSYDVVNWCGRDPREASLDLRDTLVAIDELDVGAPARRVLRLAMIKTQVFGVSACSRPRKLVDQLGITPEDVHAAGQELAAVGLARYDVRPGIGEEKLERARRDVNSYRLHVDVPAVLDLGRPRRRSRKRAEARRQMMVQRAVEKIRRDVAA